MVNQFKALRSGPGRVVEAASSHLLNGGVRWVSPGFACAMVLICILVLLLTLEATFRQYTHTQMLRVERHIESAQYSAISTLSTLEDSLNELAAVLPNKDFSSAATATLALNPIIEELFVIGEQGVWFNSKASYGNYKAGEYKMLTDLVSRRPEASATAASSLIFHHEQSAVESYSGAASYPVYVLLQLSNKQGYIVAKLNRRYWRDQLARLVAQWPTTLGVLTPNNKTLIQVGDFKLTYFDGRSNRWTSPFFGHSEFAGEVHSATNFHTLTLALDEFELVVAAQLRKSEIFQRWVIDSVFIIGASLFLSIVLMGLAFLYLRHDRQRAPLVEELRISAVAFNVQTGMMVTDGQGNILRVNRAFEDMTGYEALDIEGKTASILEPDTEEHLFYNDLQKALSKSDNWEGEIWSKKPNGETFPLWLVTSAVRDANGEVSHYVSAFSDISARKEAEEKIVQLAFYDSLTGLPNRRLFNDRLPHVMKTSHRTSQFGALMVIDLDHFKTINDTRGHDVGDALLKEVSKRLQGILRDSDTVARLGGDEFVVLLENLGNDRKNADEIADIVANKIMTAMMVPVDVREHRFNVSMSGGIVLFKGTMRSHDEVFKYADIALYAAKGKGRGRFEFFSEEMLIDLSEAVELAQALEIAIKEDKLALFLQPQFDKSRKMVAAEALIRWPQEDGTQIEPKVMIPIAEKNDLILLLGDWVLNRVCMLINRLVVAGAHPDFQLSVNISIKQFIQQDFTAQLKTILERNNTDPKFLKLELTENLMLDNIEVAGRRMRELKELGVSLDVDDFGTGFSSLSHLKSLPIDSLKIDGSFLANVGSNAESSAIIHSTIMMAQALQLKVVAEGVENKEQLKFLESHDCDLFQGYLLCMPIPLEDFESRMMQQIADERLV